MIDGFVKVVDALAKLVGALAWPAIAAVCLVWFGPSIRKFLANVGEISVDFFGLKASGKTKAELGIALAGASAARDDKPDPAVAHASVPATIEKSFNDAEEITSSVDLRSLRGKGVLWVDDVPNNNSYEVQALRVLGLRVLQTKSTIEALRTFGRHRSGFDVIISDMARLEGKRAGYDLLDSLANLGSKRPFIIYSGSNTPEQAAEAKRRGAFGSTTEPDELVRLVVEALQSGSS